VSRPLTVPETSAALLAPTADDLNHHAMLRAARELWIGPLFRAVAGEAAELDPGQLETALPATPAYAALAWLETTLQRRKYEGPHGLVAIAERSRDDLVAALDAAAAAAPDRLVLDADLVLPEYATHRDIHLMPGGLYGREIDGFVYEQAAGSTSMIGHEHQDLQSVLASEIAAFVDASPRPATVVDLGCGFGKLEHFLHGVSEREHRLIGCDLSAAALRLAHLRAVERGQRVTWVQCRAERVSICADESVDVVTSVQLLHELPDDARLAVFAEAVRMLRPGGRVMMVDFYPVDSTPLERFLHRGHTVRNGEPHLDSALAAPLARQLEGLGLADVRISPTTPNRPGGPTSWRLPWAFIVATKPGGPTGANEQS